MPAWLKVAIGIVAILPYALLLVAIVARHFVRHVMWTRADRDAILAALIEQREADKLERMRESWYDASSNTRGEAN